MNFVVWSEERIGLYQVEVFEDANGEGVLFTVVTATKRRFTVIVFAHQVPSVRRKVSLQKKVYMFFILLVFGI